MKKLFLVQNENKTFNWYIAKSKKEIIDFSYKKPLSITVRKDLNIIDFENVAFEL